MKHFIYCLNFIFFLDFVKSATNDPHKLTAVSDFFIGRALYQRIRKENENIQEPLEMDTDLKNKICYHITGSSYYRNVLDEDRVFMHQMYDKLKEDEPEIMKLIYEPSMNPDGNYDMVYTNTTKLMKLHPNVFVDENKTNEYEEEYVFACLTIRTRDDVEHVIVYYVSREYNLSDTPNPYIVGRFVFVQNYLHQSFGLNIVSIAEEPARTLLSSKKDVERSYLLRRAENTPALNERHDPICKLTRAERLRVCTLVLSSAYFETDLSFTPNDEFIDEVECNLKQISFQDEQIRLQTAGKCYEEWMISCRPDQYYATFQAEYFISRVYNSNKDVFVYRRAQNGKVVIENLFGDIRFKI